MEKQYQQSVVVAIVDDHQLYVDSLVRSLNAEPDIRVSFVARDGLDMQRQIDKCGAPHVVLLDIRMDGMDGYASADWLRENQPGVGVLMLSDITDADGIREAFDCGAGGFLSKSQGFKELPGAIRQLYREGRYDNPQLEGNAFRPSRYAFRDRFIDMLTPDRMDVLRSVAKGMTNKEIAQAMNMSLGTVKAHMDHLFDRFGEHTRTGLVRKATDMGLLPGTPFGTKPGS